MGPTWVLSAPGGPHVGPMNLAIREVDNNIILTDLIMIDVYLAWYNTTLCDKCNIRGIWHQCRWKLVGFYSVNANANKYHERSKASQCGYVAWLPRCMSNPKVIWKFLHGISWYREMLEHHTVYELKRCWVISTSASHMSSIALLNVPLGGITM